MFHIDHQFRSADKYMFFVTIIVTLIILIIIILFEGKK